MKKAVLLFVLLSLLLTGCCLKHDWMEATCTDPKSCRKCDETEGEALGHDWQDADCVNPQICRTCGDLGEKALGHDWQDADCVNPQICRNCDATEGEALGHTSADWVEISSDVMRGTCTICGMEEDAELDRDVLFKQFICIKWESAAFYTDDSDEWTFVDGIMTVEFFEDGSFQMELDGDTNKGTYGQPYYNTTQQRYEVDVHKEDGGKYSFYGYAEDNNLFLMGNGGVIAFEPAE